MLGECFKKVLAGDSLTSTEASEAMDAIMDGQASAVQVAGFLVAIRVKGEEAEEVAGFVESMRRHALPIKLWDEFAVDGCGTGGDGAHTFNISTAASIVAAGAGVMVAKHGNRSVSSRCGSADLLEVCGGNIDPGPAQVQRCINETGFGFMFAPRFHPAMRHAAAPRKELAIRTVFNMLGPLCNPAHVKRQVVGVYDKDLIPLLGEVLEMTGSEHVVIVHSRDGLDEFSVAAPSDFLEVKSGSRLRGVLSAANVGLESHPLESLVGGDAADNLAILNDVLAGKPGACRDAVVFNAGAMIYVAAKAESVAEGVALAQQAIDGGKAAAKLKEWTLASRTD